MPFSEPPLPVLVVLFLAVFILIGINPALKRAAKRLRLWFLAAVQTKDPVVKHIEDAHAGIFEKSSGSRPLNDFEIIVLRRIAQAGGKSLTRKEVNEPLLFGSKILNRTLASLHNRGLIQVRVSSLLGLRFALSAFGRRYAAEQGYMVEIHERNGTRRGGGQ